MDLQMVGEDRVALMGNGWMLEGNGGGLLAVYPGFEQVIVVCFGPEDFNIYNRLLAEGPEA